MQVDLSRFGALESEEEKEKKKTHTHTFKNHNKKVYSTSILFINTEELCVYGIVIKKYVKLMI